MRPWGLVCICLLLLMESNCFTLIFGMGQMGRKEGNTFRFQTKVTKYFCTKSVRWCDFYVIYCSRWQKRGLIIKILVNTKSKLSKDPKKPNSTHRQHSPNSLPFLGSSYTQTITQTKGSSLLQTPAWPWKEPGANRLQDCLILGNYKIMCSRGQRRKQSPAEDKMRVFPAPPKPSISKACNTQPVPRTGVSP